MNAKELQAEIETNGILYKGYSDGEWHEANWKAFRSEAGEADWKLRDETEVKGVDSYREDEYWHHIIKVDNRYFRISGDYDSWNGTEWDYADLEEVYPKEIKKTVWSTKP